MILPTSVIRQWPSYLIALVLGILSLIAYAPLLLGWPIYITLASLFWLLIKADTRLHTALIGFSFGMGYFGVGVFWIFNSVYEFGQASIFVACLLTGLFVVALASVFTLAIWLQFMLGRRLHPVWRAAISLPAAWTLSEWVLTWLLTGFPWVQVGYSQLEMPFANWAPLIGGLGVSAMTVWCVGLVVSTYFAKNNVFRAGIGIVIILILTIPLLVSNDWTQKSGSEISASLVQGNVAQEDKWTPEWVVPTLTRYVESTQANWDRDLVIWPEAALPGLYHQFTDSVIDPLQALAADNDTNIVFGILRAEEGDKIYNSVMQVGMDPTRVYYKRRLVPFGEYLPMRTALSLFGDFVQLPMGDIYPGNQPELLNVSGHSVLASVCYESAYAALMTTAAVQSAFMINVSNDAWFGEAIAPQQHLAIMRMRALENQRDILRVTNTGITAFINAYGEVVATLPQSVYDVLQVNVQPRQGRTPFSKWRHWPVLTWILILLVTSFVVSRLKSQNTDH